MDPGRSGRYVYQPAGYNAFIPEALPPVPRINLDADLHLLLSKADRALGRLDGSIQTLPDQDIFVFMYVRKEAVLSSQIEGTQSSLQDVLTAEARLFSSGRPDDVGEVINYVTAMNHGLTRLETLPLSIRLIREIHGKLLENTRGSHMTPGELRRSQNWLGPNGCTLADASYVPPPPHEVPAALEAFEDFLHGDTQLPLLVKIGLAHAQFETIHPFLNGNDRVGRLLITFLLCQQQVLQKPVLYLSHYFKAHRQEYYERLQATRDDASWENWLRFFIAGVVEVSEQATRTTREILKLRETHQHTISEKLGRIAGNGHKVLGYLYQHPILSVGEIQDLIETSYPAANDLVARLEAQGILQEITGRSRNRRFVYQRYIDLFHDGPDDDGRTASAEN